MPEVKKEIKAEKPEAKQVVKEEVKTDGKIAVIKCGVTRRIYPDLLATMQAEGWVNV
jgi:hypothetical protein